jgi:class 3 adenylate cyclase/Cdc6-like AAA superfamily ATPase
MSLGRRKYDSTPPGTPVRTSVAINSASTDSDHHPAVSPHGRKAAFSPLIGSSGQIITRPDFTRAHLSLDEMSARQIMSCVPRPVLQGIITNSLSGLSEMRTVTTLFLKLDSFTFTEYADPTCLDEFFVNMQKCLFECGGMLRQFLVDDKGCVLIGLWGVPTASHAANCSKAMRCAVMMQSASKELGYSSSIGITTGSVYCGIVGTSYRRDYVAIGRSVNLAARLMCKAHGRILLDDDTFKRLPLNVTCYTSLTETLELKGIDPGALFHCYWSTTLPISTTDISDDRILVIESYIRRDLSVFVGDKEQQQRQQHQAQEQLQEQHPLLKSNNVSCDSVSVSGSTGYHNRPMILSRHSFEETSIQGNPTPASSFHISSKILIIRGTSGSGKTALANYAIRRIIEPHAANPHFLAPVYVCLNTDDDNIPYSTIKKIVGALFAWTQLDGIHQGDFIKKMLRGAFPKFPEAVIANYIYPPLKEALGFAWEWNVTLPNVTAVSATTNGGSIGGGGGGDEPRHRLSGRHDQSPARSAGAGAGAGEVLPSASLANPLENTEKSFQLTMSEFLYFILSDGIPVVAIDDAHFMCSGSWAIINMLSRMGCSAKIILTLRVHESSFFAPSDSSFLYSPGSKEGDADLLDRSLTPGGFDLLENQSASTSSRRTDTPSRHCSEYLALCRQMDPTELFDIVLRPLSRRTIRRLLEKEFPVIPIPQDTIDVICAISRGSPYLLWKIIQYVRDSGTQNINDMISHLKDNSFMVSMLDNLPQSHGAVLKLASVIGEEFSKELLERIIPSQLVTQLSSALQNLENRGLLATLSEGHYIFSSSVIRKFVYDLIPPRYSISSLRPSSSLLSSVHSLCFSW